MHKIKGNLTLATLLAALVAAPGLASAASERSCGYAYDSAGKVVRDSAGDCVRGGFWSPAKAIAECDPVLVKKPEPVAEPAPAPVPQPVAKPAPKFKTVSLGAGALFDLNSDTIKPEGRAELDALVADIRKLSNVERIEIAGHTDSTGNAEYNRQLSMRRANAVKNYLIDKGIDPRIMTTIGYGEDKPIASNATREGRARNRRVEITLRGTEMVPEAQ